MKSNSEVHIDRRPLPEWCQRVPGVECLSMDLSEKAPAAICRKMFEAIDSGRHSIEIWGDGTQTRSFCYIDDCVLGIDRIMHSKDLIAGVKLPRTYDPHGPKGVAGRNSDNTFIRQVLDWEPRTTLRSGMERTYAWIAEQLADRKHGPESHSRQLPRPRSRSDVLGMWRRLSDRSLRGGCARGSSRESPDFLSRVRQQ